jgi:hypothetical protein
VLGFLTPPGAGAGGVPLQALFGFERVHVKAGEAVEVSLVPALAHFAHADAAGAWRPLPGAYAVHFGVAAPGQGFAQLALRAE